MRFRVSARLDIFGASFSKMRCRGTDGPAPGTGDLARFGLRALRVPRPGETETGLGFRSDFARGEGARAGFGEAGNGCSCA